ncbi:MAG: invasion protein CiaB [Candidatus Gracilibacteria bacterium]|nr:invasion protein CiaB [Candidatus Gracilibacteria bacterium]
MEKIIFEKNIQIFLGFYKTKQIELNSLSAGLEKEGEQRNILETFLEFLGLEKNDESRYAAYMRLAQLKENSLKLYLEKIGISSEEIPDRLYEVYLFVKNYHNDIFSEIIQFSKDEELFPEFYLEILIGVQKVGEAFTDFYLAWHSHLIETVNKNLESEFDNNSHDIMKYLEKNNLGADEVDGVCVDRSYSVLVENNTEESSDNKSHRVESYAVAFPTEIGEIVGELKKFIKKLSGCEDTIYGKKEAYIEYLSCLVIAFSETDNNKLVENWREVERKWMNIDTPFQITHPIEFYEDLYRKSVAPEWDIRITDASLFTSTVESDMVYMYEHFYDDIGRCKYESSYNFSLENAQRVQLYLSAPVLYFGIRFSGLFSAQVVPNDEVVSEQFGKKIFAYPEFVYESAKQLPKMKINETIFEDNFLSAYYNILENKDLFYKIYDIETIGHEYGHTLWLDTDTESVMNDSGNFKNIEEFKATTGGLMGYFLKNHTEIFSEVLCMHIFRSINLLKYKKVDEVTPYYCEALIHLSILFDSGIIQFKNGKIIFDDSEDTRKKLIELYTLSYKDLIYIYLEKESADTFLYQYTEKQGKYFIPKNSEIKNFVEYYYDIYEKIGNKVSS